MTAVLEQTARALRHGPGGLSLDDEALAAIRAAALAAAGRALYENLTDLVALALDLRANGGAPAAQRLMRDIVTALAGRIGSAAPRDLPPVNRRMAKLGTADHRPRAVIHEARAGVGLRVPR